MNLIGWRVVAISHSAFTHSRKRSLFMREEQQIFKLPITRKEAACVIHEFLRKELREPDEIDAGPAMELRDLFDCRVCAGHIIQVYVKGIMEGRVQADGTLLFCGEEPVTENEAENLRERVLRKEYRQPPKSSEGELQYPVKLTMEEALQQYRKQRNALLVDVRTTREYEADHISDAVNVPLLSIMKNPYGVSPDRFQHLFLYCSEGIQSSAAARCLLEAGYQRVYYFAGKKNL